MAYISHTYMQEHGSIRVWACLKLCMSLFSMSLQMCRKTGERSQQRTWLASDGAKSSLCCCMTVRQVSQPLNLKCCLCIQLCAMNYHALLHLIWCRFIACLMYSFAALASTSVLLLGSLLFHPYLGPSACVVLEHAVWLELEEADTYIAIYCHLIRLLLSSLAAITNTRLEQALSLSVLRLLQ